MAVREALAALDNVALVGESRMPEDVPAASAADATGHGAPSSGGIYMGQ